MTRAELIQQIALRMDEITPSSGLNVTVDGSDGNPLYSLIDGIIDDGVLELFTIAPYWRLRQAQFQYSATESVSEVSIVTLGTLYGSRKIIRLWLNDDFLRVAEINCADFQRPITEVFPEQSEQGKRQHNRFLMGKEARPVGVMSHDKKSSTQYRVIDCYSLASTSTVTADSVLATYIPKPGTIYDDTDGVPPDNSVAVEDVVPPVLIPSLEWLVAARTFGARGDANHAAICQQNAQNLLT